MSSILESCDGLPTAKFGSGDTLLNEGALTGMLFFLIDGCFEILKGDLRVTTVAEPGAIFGEVSVLLGKPHMATVRATQDSTVFVVENADTFLKSHPELNYHLSKILAKRLDGVTSYLADLKTQYEDQSGQLGMVDQVLEGLINQQPSDFSPGSDRDDYDAS